MGLKMFKYISPSNSSYTLKTSFTKSQSYFYIVWYNGSQTSQRFWFSRYLFLISTKAILVIREAGEIQDIFFLFFLGKRPEIRDLILALPNRIYELGEVLSLGLNFFICKMSALNRKVSGTFFHFPNHWKIHFF